LNTGNQNSSLKRWGLEERSPEEGLLLLQQGRQLARVLTVNRTNLVIRTADREVVAELTGKMLFTSETPESRPTVGDWISVQLFDEGEFAIVHEVLPRRSVLRRKVAGQEVAYQPIAANVDTAFVLQACVNDFNLNRLDRYLVVIQDGGVEPVLLLSKIDLVETRVFDSLIDQVRQRHPDLEIIGFSSVTEDGIKVVRSRMLPEKTYCLMGSSGVGKTTLLNRLSEAELHATASVRELDGKGRHTTTRRYLSLLESGALIIDTPGIRELGTISAETGIKETFSDIVEIAQSCKFTDCTHLVETGCAIRAAVDEGLLDEARLSNFQKLGRESAHHGRSLAERRDHDRDLSKLHKSIQRGNIKRR
jgi:ribosome biogenesis GTPase